VYNSSIGLQTLGVQSYDEFVSSFHFKFSTVYHPTKNKSNIPFKLPIYRTYREFTKIAVISICIK